ncbi:hypothetical protein BKA81DRAFT_175888 [Phyllosticta paracitricarpa]
MAKQDELKQGMTFHTPIAFCSIAFLRLEKSPIYQLRFPGGDLEVRTGARLYLDLAQSERKIDQPLFVSFAVTAECFHIDAVSEAKCKPTRAKSGLSFYQSALPTCSRSAYSVPSPRPLVTVIRTCRCMRSPVVSQKSELSNSPLQRRRRCRPRAEVTPASRSPILHRRGSKSEGTRKRDDKSSAAKVATSKQTALIHLCTRLHAF